MKYKNSEGYPDYTAGKAVDEADKVPLQVAEVIYCLKTVASLTGFEIVGRIRLRDKTTGREWR